MQTKETAEKLAWFMRELAALCRAAEVSGVVLTVEQVPALPLAMGNSRMRLSVRERRVMDTPIFRPRVWPKVHPPGLCQRAPGGFRCSRHAGHKGPCAAVPLNRGD